MKYNEKLIKELSELLDLCIEENDTDEVRHIKCKEKNLPILKKVIDLVNKYK